MASKSKLKSTRAKGARIARLGREILESEGYQVETARPIYSYVGGRPMALAHDFFGKFDAIAVSVAEVLFVQFTTDEHVSHKRKKLKGFPYFNCEVWGYKGGRNRHFRIYKKEFDYEWQGECKKV